MGVHTLISAKNISSIFSSQMEEAGGWASQPRRGGEREVRLDSEGCWAGMISSEEDEKPGKASNR